MYFEYLALFHSEKWQFYYSVTLGCICERMHVCIEESRMKWRDAKVEDGATVFMVSILCVCDIFHGVNSFIIEVCEWKFKGSFK